MSNKRVGLLLCAGLLLAGLTAAFLAAYGSFYHQHREETEAGQEDAPEWNEAEISSTDCLLRNYVFGNLAGDICGYAPVIKYSLGENGITVQLRQPVPEALDGGAEYIVCLSPDGYENRESLNTLAIYRHLVKDGRELLLVSPEEAGQEQVREIGSELSYFDKTLYSYDFDSADYSYNVFIDGESFIRYFLVMELAAPESAEKIPFYLFKNRDGRYGLCVCEFPGCAKDPEQDFCLSAALWYTMLLKDASFVDGIVNEYRTLRKGRLSEAYLEDYVTGAAEFLTENYPDCGCAEKEAEELKKYLAARLSWMDRNIESLYQYSAKSNIKNYTDDPY